MIENKILECEKKKAESELEVWKKKFKELELQVIELEKCLSSTAEECTLAGMMKTVPVLRGTCKKGSSEAKANGFRDAATPVVDILLSNLEHVDGAKRGNCHDNAPEYGSRARKQLVFGEDQIFRKNMAPLTPAGRGPAPVGFIDISDSDDEVNTNARRHENQTREKAHGSTDGGEVTPDKKELHSKSNLTRVLDDSDEDDVARCGRSAPSILTKRKRARNVVTSDSESDIDDNTPISALKKNKVIESHVPSRSKSNSRSVGTSRDKEGGPVTRQRLVSLRECEQESTLKKTSRGSLESSRKEYVRGIPTEGTLSDDEAEDNETDSEGESLNGFIVDDSDFKGDGETSKGDDSSGESEYVSDSDTDYGGIISRIGRRKAHMVKWEFEADMLAAFGKDPKLCMRAVCALYRQQTADERSSKATIYQNQRGFSHSDAARGNRLGEFLSDGDPQGDLKKSVKELREHDSKGVELCRSLATRYSNQLYAIYENREDPLWPALEAK